jgi:hypothetical protein
MARSPDDEPIAQQSGEQALYRFFYELIRPDSEQLEALEEEVIAAEDAILSPRRKSRWVSCSPASGARFSCSSGITNSLARSLTGWWKTTTG